MCPVVVMRRRRRRNVECTVVRLGGGIIIIGFLFRFPLVCVLPLRLIFLVMDGLISVLYLLSPSADCLLFHAFYPLLMLDNTDHMVLSHTSSRFSAS
jgi:hypothetical protein